MQDGRTVIADEAYLTESMMDPLAHIRAGYQPVMPSYHGILTPAQAAGIIELIKAVREIPARGPLATAGAAVPPPPGERTLDTGPPAGAEGAVPIAAGATTTLDVRPAPPSLRTAAPAAQQGVPPPGLTRNPEPRLPIQVGPPGTPPIVPGRAELDHGGTP
jgi:hypothetical protein